MKKILCWLVLLCTGAACAKKAETNSFLRPLKGWYFPKSNCCLAAKKQNELALLMDRGSKGQVVAKARSYLPASMRDQYDTLWANVQLEFKSVQSSKSIRVNGYTIFDEQDQVPVFSDSLCIWMQARGSQGTLEFDILINGNRQTIKYDPYEPMSVKVKYLFLKKDFLIDRPLHPVPPADSIRIQDTVIVASQP